MIDSEDRDSRIAIIVFDVILGLLFVGILIAVLT